MQTFGIEISSEKDDNVKDGKKNNGDDNKTITISNDANFLTSRAKISFAQLKNAFIDTPILHNFELDQYI